MRSRIPAQHRFALKLIAVGFCLGSAFQLGISTVSHLNPRVERVEVHHTVNAEANGIAQCFEFYRRAKVIELTHKELKELIEYFPETGEFRWKERDQRWFESSRSWKYWNGRYAGTVAGSKTGGSGYITISLLGKTHKAARIAWFYMTGTQLKDEEKIELIDLNKENLKWINLKKTDGKGLSNKRIRKTNKSGFTGVFFLQKNRAMGSRSKRYQRQAGAVRLC